MKIRTTPPPVIVLKLKLNGGLLLPPPEPLFLLPPQLLPERLRPELELFPKSEPNFLLKSFHTSSKSGGLSPPRLGGGLLSSESEGLFSASSLDLLSLELFKSVLASLSVEPFFPAFSLPQFGSPKENNLKYNLFNIMISFD